MSTAVKLLLSVCVWCGTTVAPPADESQRRQYEEWLAETQQLLQMQQRLLEDQVAAHRKTKKSLSAKQRTAKKAGRALAEEDAAQLRQVTELQGTVQKQLEQVRPQPQHHPPYLASSARPRWSGHDLRLPVMAPKSSTDLNPVTPAHTPEVLSLCCFVILSLLTLK